jgi:hypothetical protein
MRPCRPTYFPEIEEVFPEAPERFFRPLAVLSHKLHREAPAGAVDPVTACSGKIVLLPRREGSVEFPQTLHRRWSSQLFRVRVPYAAT